MICKNMRNDFNEEWQKALSLSRLTIAGRFKRACDDALITKYDLAHLVSMNWSASIDSPLPFDPVHDVLMAVHAVPLAKRDSRDNFDDYWAEMIWLVNAMMQEWADSPGNFMQIRHSKLRQTLKNIHMYNHLYSPISVMAPEEANQLIDLKNRVDRSAWQYPDAIQEREEAISQFMLSTLVGRHNRLLKEIRDPSNLVIRGSKDYYLHYFGLNNEGLRFHQNRDGAVCVLK